jgi:opacity protein-like surface antigen
MKRPSLRLAVILPLCFAASARAGDISLSLVSARPGEIWSTGFGAAFGIGFFKIVMFEAEFAKVPGELENNEALMLTGSVMVGPSFGHFVPYVGLGWGGAHLETAVDSETSHFSALIVGAKVKLPPLFFLKGEYRKISLPTEALLPMDSRVSLGVGVSF